jgi:hypothetical protein
MKYAAPVMFTAEAFQLIAVTLLVSWLPGRKATKDHSLRHE